MPLNGWCGQHVNQSLVAFEWLAWMEHSLGQDWAGHGGNGGEVRITGTS